MNRWKLLSTVLLICVLALGSLPVLATEEDERPLTRDEIRAKERAADEGATQDDEIEEAGEPGPQRSGQSHSGNRTRFPRGTVEPICHKPGTPAERTLYVNIAAFRAHLRHGDTRGVCPGDESPSNPGS